MADRPYSRVYWSIRDDEKFDTIRANDHHLATWLRLLIAADMAYPASADLPATVRRASVVALVDAELVDLLPGGMFRVRGLDAERERRSEAARVGGLASGRSRAVERPFNVGSTETNLAETRLDQPSNGTRSRNTVASNPLYAEMRQAIVEVNGPGMDEQMDLPKVDIRRGRA